MRKIDINERTASESQGLFLEVVEDLHKDGDSYKAIPAALKKICTHFSFGCAFIYEGDHTKRFFLKEHYATYDNPSLHDQFQLEEILSRQDIDGLSSAPVMFFNDADQNNSLECSLSDLFDAKTVLVIPILDKDDSLIGCVGMVDRRSSLLLTKEDITISRTIFSVIAGQVKLRIYEQRLVFTQTTLEGIMDNTGIDIYVNDFDTHEILYVNKSMAAPYGGLDGLMGKKCWAALYDDKDGECEYCPKKKIIDENGNPTKLYTWDYQRPFDGAWFRVLSAAFRWIDGRIAHVISSVDITENKTNEFLVEKMAFYDNLTAAPNRRKLQQDFMKYIENNPKKPATIMFLDLDDFKSINDNLGHAGGDALLIQVTRTLQSCCPEPETVYRYGGDEFIVFLRNGEYDTKSIVNKILYAFSKTNVIRGKEVQCGASIGIVEYPKDGTNYDDLLEAADKTMYSVKTHGKGAAAYFTEL